MAQPGTGRGALVWALTAILAASRDPSVFPDPLAFRPERDHPDRHIAFGRGAHMCIGQHLARIQLEECLHVIAGRLRNPRLAQGNRI